jgi:type IV pilus assembly protein PilO
MEENSFLGKIEKLKMAYKALMLVGTVVLCGGLFIWLVAMPKLDEISKTEQELIKLKEQVYQAKIRARDIEKFEKEFKEVDGQFQEALTLLPNQREIPTLLSNITKLGKDSQLEFRLFSPSREQSRDFYVEIPVSIEISGTYHNVAVFFDKIGKMERIVNILDVTMKPVKERSTELITKCDAVTYRFKGSSDAEEKTK